MSAKYNYDSPGYTSAASHFTQLVWKETTEVGCAVAQCGEGTIFADTAGQSTSYVVCECLLLSQLHMPHGWIDRIGADDLGEYRKPGNVAGNNGQYYRENVGMLQG
jgi:hypothetical protein